MSIPRRVDHVEELRGDKQIGAAGGENVLE